MTIHGTGAQGCSGGASAANGLAGARACVGAVLLHPTGRVLLGRRAASRAWLPGVWDVPGGHCERDETPEAALARELGEELGIMPRAWDHLATARAGGVTLHLFRVTRWDGTPHNAQPDEHDALAWVSADDACRLPLAHAALGAVLRRVPFASTDIRNAARVRLGHRAPADRMRRRLTRLVGVTGTLGLAASAALHVVWLVSPWPLADWAAWSRAFGGEGFRVSAPVMATVAALFAAAAYVVGVRAGLLPRRGPAWVYVLGAWALAAVLIARALVGFVEMSRTLADPRTPEPFRDTIRLYLTIYLPTFLALGACAAVVAVAARGRPPAPPGQA